MVECKFKQYPGVFYELKVEGHAKYNPGNDIVCSAVSVLAYTFFYSSVENVDIKSVQFVDKPGEYYCFIDVKKLPDKMQSKAETVFETIYSGMKHIELSYPENVHVTLDDYDRVKDE
jgi:uncharacterized protein YsxB (DUF464 family)